MRNHLLFGAAVAALVIPAAASAQQITSGIVGTVTDENGAPVNGATVTVTDTRTGAERTLTTGPSGTFSASSLVTGGPYTVTANADGFEGQTVEDIQTSLQGNTSLTFALASGAGEIVVTGSRVAVSTLAVGPGVSFNAETMRATPSFNRDIRDVIRLDPRVSLDREDAGSGGKGQDLISCLGGNNRSNTFTVDGITQSDVYGLNDVPFASRSSAPIPFDAIRETQVQFAPFDVEYGQFTGCAINAVTQSGTNQYHGGAFYEYSDSDLRGTSVAGLPVPPINPEKRWGVNVGGPIIKDKLFAFFAYEHQEAGASQDDGPAGAGFTNSIASIPVAAFNEISQVLKDVYNIDTGPLVYSRDFRNDRYFGRVDWQINDDHRLEATYQRTDETSISPDDFSSTANNARVTGLNTFQNSGSVSEYYSGRLYSQWTEKFSTELRYSRSKVVDNQGPVGGGEAQDENPIPRIIVGIPAAAAGGNNGSILAGPGFSRSSNDLRYTVDVIRAVAKLDAGNHKFKAGVEVNNLDLYNLFIQNATGTLYFRNVSDLREGLIYAAAANNTNPTTTQLVDGQTVGAHGNFSATGNPSDAGVYVKRGIYSFFLQDDWQINDRLSAVIGARVDLYDGNAPALNPLFPQRYGFSNTTGFSALAPVFQPRVALTWKPDDFLVFSRPAIRGGFGIFGGGDPGVWFGNAFQNNGITFAEGKATSAACASIRGPNGVIDLVTNGQFAGVPTCFEQDGVTTAAAGRGSTQAISPDIKAPTVWRANFGFESDLNFAASGFFSAWHLNVDYIFSRYKNPLGLVDLSQTPNITRGLNGYTVDGRPIYASLDPLAAGCGARLVGFDPVPTYAGLTLANANACFGSTRTDDLMLINEGSYDSHVVSGVLYKQFNAGLFTEGGSTQFSAGFAYTDAQDRRNQYSSTAGSVYDGSAAFDRQMPDASRSFYSSKWNITARLNFNETFIDDLSTRLGISFVARSGRPYSLTFTGRNFSTNAQAFDSELAYIPAGLNTNDPNVSPLSTISAENMQKLVNFVSGLDCAKDYVGRTIERNTCSLPWYYDVDLTFSQELPGPGRLFGIKDRIRVYGMIDNFLNLLDSGWNIQKRRNFTGWSDIAGISGVDPQGRYVFTNADASTAVRQNTGKTDYQNDEFINVSGSVWRIKVGVSYNF